MHLRSNEEIQIKIFKNLPGSFPRRNVWKDFCGSCIDKDAFDLQQASEFLAP